MTLVNVPKVLLHRLNYHIGFHLSAKIVPRLQIFFRNSYFLYAITLKYDINKTKNVKQNGHAKTYNYFVTSQ